MSRAAGIGKIYREKLGLVLRSNPGVIMANHVSEVLDINRQEAGRLLSRWHKGGWISRIKRGAYIPIHISSKTNEAVIEELNLVADLLYRPGYIGGFTAIKHWDLSEQIIESITYFTLNRIKDRHPSYGGIKFTIKTISNYKVFGLKSLWYGRHKVQVSDPSKTIIDMLDDPKIVGGIRVVSDILSEYIESDYFEMNKLIEYGKKMKNRTIFKRLGFLSELKLGHTNKAIRNIRSLVSPSYSDLDPTLHCKYLLKDWKLRVSKSWKFEYDRKK